LTRAEFEKICVPLFKKCLAPVKKALSDAEIEIGEVCDIVMVGGSSRIPRLH